MDARIRKVLLIVPPAHTTVNPYRDINPLPPLGLGYLASVIEREGIEVNILDCLVRGWNQEVPVSDNIIRVGLFDEQITDFINQFDPDLIGVNCQFSRQYKIHHHLFSLIKKIKPKCIVVAGGAHVTVCPQEVINDINCDFIITGEAELSFKNLVLAINKGGALGTIDGLGLKLNNKIHLNPKKEWIADLDSLPFPAYHLMELKRYFGLDSSHGSRHRERFCPVVTSRGCPAKCTFCSANKVWGENYRARSVKNVLEELKLLKNQYKIEELMFEDDNVTANLKRAKELFSGMIKEKLDFVWDTPNGVGVWSVDEDLLDLMKESGCLRLNFPVESGSQRVLKNIIKKPLNLARVKQLIRYCKKIKLDYCMFLVIGLPGETIKDIWASFKFAASCGVYNPLISVATPYPGTQLFEECRAKDLFEREFSLDDLFIRGFMIKTDIWNKYELQRALNRGIIYLKFMKLINHPLISIVNIKNKLKEHGLLFYTRKLARILTS